MRCIHAAGVALLALALVFGAGQMAVRVSVADYPSPCNGAELRIAHIGRDG